MSKITEGWKKSGDKQRAKPEDVKALFQKVHGDFYDYSKMVYIRNRDKVEIICPVHGSFWQSPRSHKEGSKCPKCAMKIMAKSKELSAEENLRSFTNVLGDTYDYSKVKYQGSHVNVDIICKTHGTFSQTPAVHRKGSGCTKCSGHGFNYLAPAILYYVKVTVNDKKLYKVGITNRSVSQRFGPDMQYITVIKTWNYEVGADAYQAEQTILEANKDFKYTGPKLLRSGNTELFLKDV